MDQQDEPTVQLPSFDEMTITLARGEVSARKFIEALEAGEAGEARVHCAMALNAYSQLFENRDAATHKLVSSLKGLLRDIAGDVAGRHPLMQLRKSDNGYRDGAYRDHICAFSVAACYLLIEHRCFLTPNSVYEAVAAWLSDAKIVFKKHNNEIADVSESTVRHWCQSDKMKKRLGNLIDDYARQLTQEIINLDSDDPKRIEARVKARCKSLPQALKIYRVSA